MKKTLLIMVLFVGMASMHGQVLKRTGILLDTLTTIELNALDARFKISGSLFWDRTQDGVVSWDGTAWSLIGSSFTGDVTAASAFGTDNSVIRSDGTGKGVQGSGITIDDSDNIDLGGSEIQNAGESDFTVISASTGLFAPILTDAQEVSYSKGRIWYNDTDNEWRGANDTNDGFIVLSPDGTGTDDQTLAEVLTEGFTTGGNGITFNDNDPLNIGTGSDLRIIHNGSNTYFDNYTSQIVFRDADNSFAQDFVFNFDTGTITAGGVTLGDSGTDDQNLSEVLTEGNDAGALKITNLADPTLDQDAATKAYVDGIGDDLTITDSSDNYPSDDLASIFDYIASGAFSTTINDEAVTEAKIDYSNAAFDEAFTVFEASDGRFKHVKGFQLHPDSDYDVNQITFATQSEIDAASYPNTVWAIPTDAKDIKEYVIYLGVKDADIETGTDVEILPIFESVTITDVKAFMGTAPTGSTAIFDINEDGVSMLSTKLSVDANEQWSSTASSTVVISDTTVDADSVISFDIDQIGSSTAGTDVVIKIYYYEN